MKVIYKFPLQQVQVQGILLPKDAVILTVQAQQGIPCIWVLLDPSANTVLREIVIAKTGGKLNDEGMKYIGTFQLFDGTLVFHVFEHIGG